MAAMAPALTDAPAEAHHIRFKLAPPSSTLSPGSVENNSNASNILISSNGAVKRKALVSAGEERSLDFRPGGKKEEQQHDEAAPTPLGKLQPLVASYLCSDVTSVPSTKESLKLQGVLIKQSVLKTHGILPNSYFTSTDFLPRKHQTLELSGEQLKSLMSGSGQPAMPATPPPPQAPVNGLAKKLARPGVERGHVASVNGDRPPTDQDSLPQVPREPDSSTSRTDSASRILLKGGAEQQQPPAGIPHTAANDSDQPAPAASATSATTLASPGGRPAPAPECPGVKMEDQADWPSRTASAEGAGCGGQDGLTPSPACDPQQPALSAPDAEVRDRTLQSQSRQSEIEGRLRRLRKRLQVVQAKQVERHVQQQLGSLLQTTLRRLPGQAALSRRAEGAPRRAEHDVGRFLRSGSVPSELERLSLSGTANLRAAETAFDSDATESSSGGETDVEEEELARADLEQRHISLWRRAEGRYALERASIISHWNWLQAHISDLEYRIRQQTDIFRQIRSNKGLIVLGDSAPCEVSLEDGAEVKAEPVICQVTQERSSDGAEGSGVARHPSADPGLWKGWAPGRPLNGVLNSLRPGRADGGSPESSDAEEQLGRKQQQQRPPLAPSPQDGTCVAARTRPILSCKKRRLVRPSTVAHLNRKVQRMAGPRCSCDVNPMCFTCSSRTTPCGEFQFERPLLERLSQFDPCVHPILSFTDDVSMTLHFQRLLKSHWQNRPLERIKPLKKLSLKHKIPLSGRLPDSSSSSKDKHKLTNSLITAVRLSHQKMRPDKLHRQQQQLDSLLSASKLEARPLCKERSRTLSQGGYDKGHGRKRPREHSLERSDSAPKLYPDACSPCSSSASLHTPTHSPLMRQLSTSSESSTPYALNSQSSTSTPQPIRRRRGESSFDINNIVIPMSVAATTRVEKLQYKEILTPSWREVDICAQPITEEDNNVEVEDLSDAAFSQLHLPYEEQERSRWSWTASAMAKRRGSRSYKSLDGRTTPLMGGTNPSTPQPSSPDTVHFHLLQDYGPVASPCSPASPDLSNPHTPHRLQPSEDTRCSTPDFTFEELVPQPVQPWERRTFPLECDPAPEPDGQASPAGERGARAPRRVSVSRPDNGPPSPGPDDCCKQKACTPLRPAHR